MGSNTMRRSPMRASKSVSRVRADLAASGEKAARIGQPSKRNRVWAKLLHLARRFLDLPGRAQDVPATASTTGINPFSFTTI
jgi:hypothetical protein